MIANGLRSNIILEATEENIDTYNLVCRIFDKDSFKNGNTLAETNMLINAVKSGATKDALDRLGNEAGFLAGTTAVAYTAIEGTGAVVSALKPKPISQFKISLQFFAENNLTKGISKKILDGSRVAVENFKNGKLGRYILEQDRALNSGAGTHGGSYWKLKKIGEAGYWTLDKSGNILRMKK